MKISKSKFVAGAQCLKRVYLQAHQPELAGVPDAAADAIVEQGREVGRLARQHFAVLAVRAVDRPPVAAPLRPLRGKQREEPSFGGIKLRSEEHTSELQSLR